MATLSETRVVTPVRAKSQLISPGLVAAALIATGLCLWLQLQNTTNPLVWALVLVSVLPTYSAVYHAVLFARAAFMGTPAAEPTAAGVGEGGAHPTVAFILASYQEPFEVAKMTFDSARDTEYAGRREIIVVDNSPDTASDDFRRWQAYVESHIGRRADLRVVFAYNTKKGGLKPGNVDLAQTLLGDDTRYVILLDVDSSLPRNAQLLGRAVAQFQADAQLGMLQFHTTATNNHFNALTEPVAVAQNSLRIKHLLRADGGFAMFYGHNAMWRRELVEQFGPWLEHHRGNVMVTEDLLKSVGAYTRGYTCRYLDIPSGEWIPSSLDALENMWLRWTYGGLQVVSKYWRSIVKTPHLGKVERLDLITFLSSHPATAVFYPLSFLWIIFLSPAQVSVMTFFMMYVPTLLGATVVYRRYSSELRAPAWKKAWHLYAGYFLIEPFIFAVNMKAVWNYVTRRPQGWKVTAKHVEETPSWGQVIRRHRVVVGFAVAILGLIAAAWGLRFGFAASALLAYLPTAATAINLLICIALYGRQGRRAETPVEGTTIDGYTARNQGGGLDMFPVAVEN